MPSTQDGLTWNRHLTGLRCIHCGHLHQVGPLTAGCPRCRTREFVANLWLEYDLASLRHGLQRTTFTDRRAGLAAYNPLLPVEDASGELSLAEGNTPLLPAPYLRRAFSQVWLKDETRNPTFSYKDRLCYTAVSAGALLGRRVACVASSGNHGAATAAYARRAGMECVVIGTGTPLPVMAAQMRAYGAKLVRAEDTERWRVLRRCVEEYGWWPTGNYTWPLASGNPFGPEGYKTIAYEVWRDLGERVPDVVLVPVARGEGLAGVWKGFLELAELGLADRLPRMVGVEPEAGGPLARAWRAGRELTGMEMLTPGRTVAVSIGGGVSSTQALLTVRDSGGHALTVSDEEILAARARLAEEGLLVEAAAATAVAGLSRLEREVPALAAGVAAVVLTGSGLKDAIPLAVDFEPESVPVVTADDFARTFRDRFGVDPSELGVG